MDSYEMRAALERHWAASNADDFEMEHELYSEDAILDYPQSGERIRGRQRIQASRMAQSDKKRFILKRIVGAGELWVSELLVTYSDQPFHVVSVMEVASNKVVRETQYFADPFEPGMSRRQWTERRD